MPRKERQTGRAGGETTVTPGGLIKHTVYIPAETLDRIREKAFYQHTSISVVIRRAIDQLLEKEDG